jgi:hypothetical protein
MDFLTRDDWNQYGVESVALDPNDPKFVIVATGTYINSWAGNGAILRSENAGNTWERIDLPFKNGGNWGGRSMGERLLVHPKDRNTIFFGTRLNGLQVSKDRGRTWSQNQGLPAAKPPLPLGIDVKRSINNKSPAVETDVLSMHRCGANIALRL